MCIADKAIQTARGYHSFIYLFRHYHSVYLMYHLNGSNEKPQLVFSGEALPPQAVILYECTM
jgi:hypothetical protein